VNDPMHGRALFPAAMFEVCRPLIAGFEVVRDEIAGLAPDEFVPWGDRGSYSDGWVVYPLVKTTMPPGFSVDFRKHRARCPRTWQLLRDPRIVLGACSRLLPGCHVYRHTDNPAFDMMRFHLALSNAGCAGMRVPGHELHQTPGQAYVFDTSLPHEAANLGTSPRDVLLVDFRLSDQEVAEVDRLRREFTPGADRDALAYRG
jgi:hypothetical protein